MAKRKQKEKPKTKAEKLGLKNAPKLGKKAKEAAAKAKVVGRKSVLKTKMKRKLKGLKQAISKGIESAKRAVLALSNKDKIKLGKALGLDFSKLTEKQILTKISQLSLATLENAETVAGTGARIFAQLETNKGLKPIEYGYKFKKGDKLTIDFRNNQIAENKYGMRILFEKQPEIRQVRLKQKGPRGQGREGIATRRTLNGDFYFDDGRYAPIFTDTEIEIVSVWTKEELDKYKKGSYTDTVGGRKRYVSKKDARFYRDWHGIKRSRTSKDDAIKEYWRRIAGTQQKPKLTRNFNVEVSHGSPNFNAEKFRKDYEEVERTTDVKELAKMINRYPLNPNDPIIRVPGRHPIKRPRLRLAVAWRFILARRYANLRNWDLRIISSFRSYRHQHSIWKRALRRYGSRGEASKWVAPAENGRNSSNHGRGDTVDFRLYATNGKRIELYKYRGSKYYHTYVMRGRSYEEKMARLDKISGKIKRAHYTQLKSAVMLSQFIELFGFNKPYWREAWHWSVRHPNNPSRVIYKKTPSHVT